MERTSEARRGKVRRVRIEEVYVGVRRQKLLALFVFVLKLLGYRRREGGGPYALYIAFCCFSLIWSVDMG